MIEKKDFCLMVVFPLVNWQVQIREPKIGINVASKECITEVNWFQVLED